MWINGTCYKSLNFTVLYNQILQKIKKQTYRTLYIPKYEINEIIAITFEKKFLYLAKIKDFYPRQLKDLTHEEAVLDGFSSISEMQDEIKKLNMCKSLNQWGFITRFEPILDLVDFINNLEAKEAI